MTDNRRYKVKGQQILKGDVVISGAKNAALPIVAATVLTGEAVTLRNVPDLADINNLLEIINRLGGFVSKSDAKVTVLNDVIANETDQELSGKLRASVLLLGQLVARFGEAKVYQPGGCNIGERSIDLHLKGLEKLGAIIKVEKGYVKAKAKRLVGAKIELDFPSVGATQNLMMAATLAEGVTTIIGAAKEPEIEDLAKFINAMGGNVTGAGTNEVTITGVDKLEEVVDYSIMPDRIEAGTFLVAAAMNHKNDVTVRAVRSKDLSQTMEKLEEMGVSFIVEEDSIRVKAPMKLRATDIVTMPHPGFPTDMQAQLLTILAFANGKSVVKETIFENRMNHAVELKKIGANITVNGNTATINGGKGLFGKTKYVGASLHSYDLRGGASMILAALNCKGDSEILDIKHIERGYENVVEKFRALGAEIELIG